jgi:hypothetical protein
VDEEYSVIPISGLRTCRTVRTWDTEAAWLGWPYFEAALADAPASARPDTSSAAARIASVPVMVGLYIPASIWFETTQTEQALISVCRRFLSTTLSAVLLSLWMKLISFFEEGKNQSSDARKISKTKGR